MPVLSRMELRGLEKGEQRGRLLGARESVIEVLKIRFEDVPQTIKEAVNQIEDVARLKQLHKQAITVASLIEFEQLLG
jgi:predicted transposase YdaD